MSLLRAKVRQSKDGWWEMALLDLNIVADGDSEDSMLRDLEHSLVVEYRLAMKNGEAPFARLFQGCPEEVSRSWKDGGKTLRHLALPFDVRRALAAIFRQATVPEFTVQPVNDAA